MEIVPKTTFLNKTNETNIKYKNVKINENTNGKGIKIGHGGFGKVYKVFSCNEKEKTFAQKHMYIFERDGNLIGQNLKEISLGYKYLNNENLQNFQNIYIDNSKKEYVNSKYIVNMDLADMTFNELIYSKLSKNNRILFFFPILKQLLNGIKSIHTNFICHGDIKPENILIFGDKKLLNECKTGENYLKDYLKTASFKITDYSGLNIEYNNSMDNTSTLYYKPPELFLKMDKKFKKSVKETHGEFNDVWSIGITMLEFLTQSNIISKLYKNMKITEKEFLIRFFHCMKSVDISLVLKNNDYNIDNYYVKNIINLLELMLTKKIKERINVNNLSLLIEHYTHKYHHLYKNNNICMLNENKINIIEYKSDIYIENIDIKLRKNAINKLYEFLEIEEYSDPNDKQYIPLALTIFDRLISKNILNENNLSNEYMYMKLLLECYYIASKYLLSDIDIIFFTEYLNIDIDDIHNDILQIIKELDFDIYRPTILTILNKEDDDIYHSQYVIDNAIYYFCDSENINTNNINIDNIKLIDFDLKCIDELKLYDIDNELDETNEIQINNNLTYPIPKLKRDEY